MRIKETGTYAGRWYEIVEPFSESDFDIKRTEVPRKNQGKAKGFRKGEWKTNIEAGISMTLSEDALYTLVGIESYPIKGYVLGLKRSSRGSDENIVLNGYTSQVISYRGIKLEASKQKRFEEFVDKLKAKYDPQKIIDSLIEGLNKDLADRFESSNAEVLRGNLKRTDTSEWKAYVDEKGSFEPLAKEIAEVSEKLEALKKDLHDKRNDSMLKIFEGEIEWGIKDEDNDHARLPEDVINGFRELLKSHKGFNSFTFGRL